MGAQHNTYRKLDRDSAHNKVDKESMYDCRNFRPMGNDPNDSGALVNMLGNELLQSTFPGYSNDTCIGSTQLRELTILITTNSSQVAPTATYGRLWKWDFKNWTAPVLLYSGLLNLSKANPILNNIVARYESETLQKVYWADGYNNLRYANIADPDIGSLDPDDFNIINEVDFKSPVLEQILGGVIPVGRVQYSYRLYKRYGPQTTFAPASPMINLTTENENVENTSRYGGADRLDEDGNTQSSGKSIKMKISDIDDNFDKIEIVAIHYSDIYEEPNIWIVQNTDTAPNIYFTDTGTYNQGYYTLSEYAVLSNLFIPKTIATKNNILFAADIETEEFDVEYDARAYRYRSNHSAYIYDSSGDYYRVTPSGNIYNYGNAPPAATLADIPETFDCTQSGADITSDPGALYDQWQSGISPVRGGEGVNVKYEFKIDLFTIDTTEGYSETFSVPGQPAPQYWSSYASPYNSGYKVGYFRDEIYRFGIIFFSKYGQPSPVKWIGDIRMPRGDHEYDGGDSRQSTAGATTTYGRRLYLEFTVNNIPEEAVGWQIVRVERKVEDRTIAFQGKMTWFGDLKDYIFPAPVHWISTPNHAEAGQHQVYRYGEGSDSNRICNLWINAPEVSFYKDYKVAAGDYIEVIGYYDSKYETSYHNLGDGEPYGANASHNFFINKFNLFTPLEYSYTRRRDIVEGFTYEAPEVHDQIPIQTNIAGVPIVNAVRFPLTGYTWSSLGDAGTGVVINVGSALDLNQLPFYSYPVVNVRRPVIQYGGRTYEDRLVNKYIPASEYFPKTGANMVKDCYGGDCFIQFFDCLSAYFNNSVPIQNQNSVTDYACGYVDYFPVETTINLDLRHDDCYHQFYNGDDSKYFIREHSNATFTDYDGVEQSPGRSDYYLYNTVFSRAGNARQYISLAEDYVLNRHNDSLVMASNAKLNNEEVDAWGTWDVDETLPLDGGYGAIKYMIPWNNILMFYQENGFGTLSVLERSLVQDSEGRNLSLGEGDVLQRYDMISTEIGCSTRNSLLVTPSGVIWFDNKQKRIYRISKNIENLGMIKGMNSYFQAIPDVLGDSDNTLVSPYQGFIMGYNSKYSEVWFTVKTGDAYGETLVFNDVVEGFTHFVDNNRATFYINHDDIFISQRRNGWLYKENSEANERGWFYNTIQDAIVEIIMNPSGTLVHKLTNIELTTEVIDSGGNNILDETLTEFQITNDYQNTEVNSLVPGTNVRRLLRTWRINALRDYNSNARLRDTYHKIKLVFRNSEVNPRKVVLHDLLSVFEIQNEAIVNKK